MERFAKALSFQIMVARPREHAPRNDYVPRTTPSVFDRWLANARAFARIWRQSTKRKANLYASE